MSSLAALEDDKSQYQEQLTFVIASLKDDPDNAELLSLQQELETAIQIIDESIAELKPQQKKAPPKPPNPPPEKWSRENHPAFKKVAAAAAPAESEEPSAPLLYAVNDTVMAKWVSGDKAFYPARITSVTGSSTAPVYTVKFKSYDTVETLRARDIRPIAAPPGGTKRKADGTPAAGTPAGGSGPGSQVASPAPQPPAGDSGVVTSAAASMYPQPPPPPGAEAAGEEAPVKKFKKIKAKKELEAGKSKWQEFNAKSKFGKNNKKDSMFRTPEGVKGRVGFTGSGQAMRKDPTRSRHVYQPNEELD